MACEFCGNATQRGMKFGVPVDTCATCAAYSYRGLQEISPAALYSRQYFEGGEYSDYLRHARAHGASFERKLRIISRYRSAPFRALEVGCALGFCSQTLFAHGASSYTGVDVSSYAIEYAKNHFQGTFLCSELPPVQIAQSCSLLVAWDVIEHLQSPAEYLVPLLKCLPAGSIFAATTIDSGSFVAKFRKAKWRQFHPPTHLHYPTRESLRCLVKRCGMEVRYHRSFGQFRALEAYLQALSIPVQFLPETLRTYPVPVNLGDTQLLIAEKL